MSLSSDSLRPSFNCQPAPWIIQDKVSSGLLITYGSHIVAGRAMRSRPIRGARPPMGHGLSLEKCGQAIVERPEELRLLYLVTGDIYTDGQQFFRLQSRDLNGRTSSGTAMPGSIPWLPTCLPSRPELPARP